MNGTVWMRHPELPEHQLIEVAEEAIPHHSRSGWQVVDPETAQAAVAERQATFSQPEPDSVDEPAVAGPREAPEEEAAAKEPEAEPNQEAEPQAEAAPPKRRRRAATADPE